MKKMISMLFMISVLSPLLARSQEGKESPADKACQAMVDRLVKSTAKSMGMKKQIGIHWHNEGSRRDDQGRKLGSFVAPSFIVDEGMLNGSGATAEVVYEGRSCRVLKLTVSIGQ